MIAPTGSTTSESALVVRIDRIAADTYVREARARGRERHDREIRAEMAQVYEDHRPLLRSDRLSPRSRSVLRLVEPVLQAEWKLMSSAPSGEEHDQSTAAGRRPPWASPLERRGKNYVSYGNLRVLTQVLGANRHTTDATVERAVWSTIGYLASSWASFEERTLSGTEPYSQARRPPDRVLATRSERLRAIARDVGDGPLPMVISQPPRRWADYLPDPDGRRRLEFLTAFPQTEDHEEVAFLRTIHLTETCLWGILTRLMSAVELLKAARWEQAAACLARANRLVHVQNSVFEVMKSISQDDFLAFRASTGDSSAVQSTTNHLVQIFMQGVDPAKSEALASIPENAYLLRYANSHFVPLSAILPSIPSGDPDGAAAIEEALKLDREMYRWRAAHYGVARRYLPAETAGTGGTAGAAYLKGFYHHRISGVVGSNDEAVRLEAWSDPEPPFRRVRARPVLSWEN